MGRLAFGIIMFVAVIATNGPASGFFLGAGWTEEQELDYPLYTEQGRCLLGKTTVMRHAVTREWHGLFTPFDNDVIALSGGAEATADGEARKVVKLEPSNTVGTYADFQPVFEDGQCVAFTIVLFDDADREVARHMVYKDQFHALVSDAEIPSVTRCEPGRVSRTTLGQWTDFSCPTSVQHVFRFSPFDATDPIVAVWNEQGSDGKDDVQVFFALKTRSGRWAKTRMVNDLQLQWNILKEPDGRVVAFEVTLRDEAGHQFVRRIYDQPETQ
jgi:hypothetical protein